MCDSTTILTITNDGKFLQLFRQQIHDQLVGDCRVIVAGTIDEACAILKTARPGLVVVHWGHDSDSYEELDKLLWTTTVQARQVPVLVMADRYRTEQATMMFRMGVSEYISRTHHLKRLGPVFSAYLPLAPITADAVLADRSDKSKKWSSKAKSRGVSTQAV